MSKSISQLIDDNDVSGLDMALSLDAHLVNSNQGYDQPIHIAAGDGKYQCVATLLSHGAEVNGRDEDGRTALHRAAQLYPDVVDVLLAHGAESSVYDKHGYTPFAWAVFGQQSEGEKVIDLLRTAGAHYGLLEAVSMGDPSTVNTILANDANAIANEPSDEALITMACLGGRYGQLADRTRIVELLLKNGIELSDETIDAHIRACDKCGFHTISNVLRGHRKGGD